MSEHVWIGVSVVIESFFVVAIVTATLVRRTSAIFATGFNVMIPVVALFLMQAPGFHVRVLLGAAVAGIYLFRLNWVILVWTRNTAMSKLDETLRPLGKIGLAFVLTNFVGFGYCLPFYFIGNNAGRLNGMDALAVAVYIIGSIIHGGADYQKVRFKRKPGTRGRILDTGWWSLCRHPNYFGDFLIYVSFALLAQHPYGWIAPMLNLAQYLFDAIPKNEKWASKKYGSRWDEYVESTPMFVPLLSRRRRKALHE